MNSLLQSIIDADISLFLFLNGLHNALFDHFFWWVTQALTWMPLYLLLFWLIIKTYGRRTLMIILFTCLCIAITDLIAFHAIKETVMRLRPGHNPDLEGQVHFVNGYKGGMYGFVSSHAANFFGIALFIGLLLKKRFRYMLLLLPIWAFLISYSRIYLGVHYPGDILCGALLGIITGIVMYYLYRFFSLKVLDKSRFFTSGKTQPNKES